MKTMINHETETKNAWNWRGFLSMSDVCNRLPDQLLGQTCAVSCSNPTCCFIMEHVRTKKIRRQITRGTGVVSSLCRMYVTACLLRCSGKHALCRVRTQPAALSWNMSQPNRWSRKTCRTHNNQIMGWGWFELHVFLSHILKSMNNIIC